MVEVVWLLEGVCWVWLDGKKFILELAGSFKRRVWEGGGMVLGVV